jgi:hypothetical protein
MNAATSVTTAQAQAALAAVRAQFRSYLEPLVIDDTNYGATCSEPVLVMEYEPGVAAICWEDGPDDWAFLVTLGGTSEESRVLHAEAAEEFGVPVGAPADVEPARMPEGVTAEPFMSCVLGLFPAA